MDHQRFDEIARRLAAGVSRRTLLRLLGASGAGLLCSSGALDRLRGDVAAAPPPDACQPQFGGHCTTAIPCCSGVCDDDGRCGCLPGKVMCRDACVDSNDHNCGACGHECGPGQTCCDGVCVFLEADEGNCGACGVACGEGETCCFDRCVNLSNDPHHCAECGHDCGKGDCISGFCRGCGGHDCLSDAECCGACCAGRCCQNGEVCIDGECCGAAFACGSTCCPPWSGCVDGQCQSCPEDLICKATGHASCGPYTTEGLCCPWPAWAACCCESAPGANDGWAGCCIKDGPGADCPPCVGTDLGGSGGPGQTCGGNTPFPECCYSGVLGGIWQQSCPV